MDSEGGNTNACELPSNHPSGLYLLYVRVLHKQTFAR